MNSRSPSSDTAEAKSERVAVGRVVRAHGIRGEVKVDPWSDVEDRFDAGAELVAKPPQASARTGRTALAERTAWTERTLQIVSCRPDRAFLLVRFAGVEDRNSAEELCGAVLEVPQTEVPEAPEGFYYHFQLVGCRVYDAVAGELGEVVEVLEDGGGHVLRTETAGTSILLPFVDAFLRRVDVGAGRIDVELPEGLIESCTSRR